MSARRYVASRAAWLTLSALKWRGLRFLDRLTMQCADIDALVTGDRAALACIEGLSETGAERLFNARQQFDLAAHEAELAALGLEASTPADAHWPEALRNLVDPPLALYHRGPLPGREPVVGIVGTRAATPYGLGVARRMALELAAGGVTVISGLAQGIDGAAHAGALEARDGRTVAVLAGGAHVCYPPGHRDLYARLLERGTVLSEVPPGVAMAKWLFPLRNRIVSGLCSALVVIEAPEKSGAMITARHAAEQGREVLAVPGPVTSPASTGSHRLIRDGAQLVTGAADVFTALGSSYQPVLVETEDMMMTGEMRVVLDLLRSEALSSDEILERSRLRPGRLYRLLLDLSAAGVVSRHPGNRWMKNVVSRNPAQLKESIAPDLENHLDHFSSRRNLYFIKSGGGPAAGAIVCDGDSRLECA